jgi:hypothetical protein
VEKNVKKKTIMLEECRITVFPCKKCGQYPVWGAGYLICPKDCYESECNRPNGTVVRDWNKHNKPEKR